MFGRRRSSGYLSEEDVADRLTAQMDRENPDWDIASRIATCKTAMLHGHVTPPEASSAFGTNVFRAAWEEIGTMTAKELAAAGEAHRDAVRQYPRFLVVQFTSRFPYLGLGIRQ